MRKPVAWWQSGLTLGIIGVFLILGLAGTIETVYFGVRQKGITTAAWVTGSITLLLAVAFMWVWVMWRRQRRLLALRLAAENVEHPVGTQQLPLTPDMLHFLQQEAEVGSHPAVIALLVLGAASVIPAIFTVVFAVQGQLLNPYLPFAWIVFLGLGSIGTFFFLRDLRQEKRDLLGGVFNRATGSFSIQVTTTRYGTTVQVVIGSRRLGSVTAPALESIESFSGGVDYLPASGDLLEVRDESGHALWSKFSGTATPKGVQSAAR